MKHPQTGVEGSTGGGSPEDIPTMTNERRDAGRTGHYGASVEYALHCIGWLAEPRDVPPSSRDLADLQGVSPSLVAKIMPRLEKAGLVVSTGGVKGGYRLARETRDISVLDVVDAIEGDKRLFDCKEIRGACVLFDGSAPDWATRGTCGIHAVFLRAEKAMRAEMARTSLDDLGLVVAAKTPPGFSARVTEWLDERVDARETARLDGVKARRPAGTA